MPPAIIFSTIKPIYPLVFTDKKLKMKKQPSRQESDIKSGIFVLNSGNDTHLLH